MEKTRAHRATAGRLGAWVVVAVLLFVVGRRPADPAPASQDGVAARQPAMLASAASAPAPVLTAASDAAPAASAPVASSAARLGHPGTPAMPPTSSSSEALRKVQLALGGGSAEQALQAAHELNTCSHAAQHAEALFHVRDQPPQLPPELKKLQDDMGGVTQEKIRQAQDEQRRCQVFDAAMLARRGELLQKAYEGGAQGASMAYLQWLQFADGTPGSNQGGADAALVARLKAEVRSAAETGDLTVLAGMAFAAGDTGRLLGITPVQQQAYKEAWLLILDDGLPGNSAALRASIERMEALIKPATLTAAQQDEARRLTDKVLDTWRRSKGR